MLKLVERLKNLNWPQRAVVAAFILVAGFTAFQASRAVRHALYWSHHRDEPIHGWMSVGYVARSYQVPPHLLYEALGLQHQPHDRKPIRQIATEQNRPVREIIDVLQAAIARARQSSVQPGSGSAGTPDRGRAP